MMPAELLTVPQAAALAGRSERWVLAHAYGERHPMLPAIRTGTRGYRTSWLFRREDVLALVAHKKPATPPPAPIRRPMIGREETSRIIPGWHEAPEPCAITKTTEPCSVCGKRKGEMHDHGGRILCRACCGEGR